MKTMLHFKGSATIQRRVAAFGFLAFLLLLCMGNTGFSQVTFNYTGAVQTYTVPLGVTSITVDVYGAAGFGLQGYGGRVQATHTVTGGEVLNIYVGGQGTELVGGYNGGGNPGTNTGYAGGGGASDIRQGGTALSNRIIVAGGGGGSGSNCGTWTAEGGHGGGLVGQSGCAWSCSDCQYTGAGGGQSAGGIAGPTAHGSCGGNTNGTLGQGGSNTTAGYGTGGGGGYYGGGSGCFEGAGGGSSYTGPMAGNVTHTQGARQGNGMIIITANTAPCPQPSNVIANPTMICQGSSADITATSAGNTISWYTVAVGGVAIGTSASGANFSVSPTVTTTYYAEAAGSSCSASPRVPVAVTLDNILPTAVCSTATVTLDTFGFGTLAGAAVGSGSTDNCTISSYSVTPSLFTCANIGANSVTLTVTDNNGNTSSCAATVTVAGSPIAASVSALSTACGYNVSCPGGSDAIATVLTNYGCPGFTYLWSNGNTSSVAGGLGAGTVTVTVTDNAGTTTVTSITITEPAPFQMSAVTTSPCVGGATGTIDLSVTGGNDCQGYTYAWDNGGVVEDISGLAPGTYSVTVTDMNGCTGTHSVTITAAPAPTPTFTQVGHTFTSTQTWSSYQWLFNGNNIPGANANSFVWSVPGTYSLMVTDSNGCSGLSDTTFVVGIADQMGDWADLSLFPNPARGEFHLRTAVPIGYAVEVNVTDVFGKRLFAQTLPELGREVAFDIKALAAGTYLVQVSTDAGQRKVFRLVVN